MTARRFVSLAVAALAILAGLHLLLWRWSEQQLAAGFSAWAAASRTHGWTVTSGTPQRSGWPLSATLILPEAFVSGGAPDLPGGLTWSADRVVLRVDLLRPRSLSVSAEGLQRLRLGDLPDIPYTADRLRAVLPLEPDVAPRAISVRAINLRAGIPAAPDATGAVTIAAFDLAAGWTPAAQQNEPAVTITVHAELIGLPAGGLPAGGVAAGGGPAERTWPLGPRIALLDFTGALGGPLPRIPGLAARAAAWRDGGGTLDVNRVALKWGPLDLGATATLALDESLQPMGTGTMRLRNAAAALDVLAANHAIGDRAAIAAKALLALMTHPAADGTPEVEVPLTLQDRRLSVGRIPLTRLPEFAWAAWQ